jgi:micrococcal nuclease
MSLPLLAVLGCYSLDDVPLFAGAHCDLPREATVVRVLDGDTLQLDSCEGETVRLLGVSAPEVVHDVADACVSDPGADAGERDDCFGPEARAAMADLLVGQTVRLEFDATCADRYGRTLAYVYLPGAGAGGSDLFVNQWVILKGYARVYEDFDDILQRDVLYTAQYAAESASAGLWGTCE